ncbi:hypothetical protein H6P81_005374 [Aristolochia fimbriata]|uniref:Uncharacterized protein n=1 Tax=Aristolochia fimbriata TaxID=158543 RepID=A0AAV7EWG4_ARIFI|nr:hypothetical protein H6P81_005374 [Aristolochia fimbriata]
MEIPVLVRRPSPSAPSQTDSVPTRLFPFWQNAVPPSSTTQLTTSYTVSHHRSRRGVFRRGPLR